MNCSQHNATKWSSPSQHSLGYHTDKYFMKACAFDNASVYFWMNEWILLNYSVDLWMNLNILNYFILWITNKLTWGFHIQKWCEPVCLSIPQGLKTPNEFPVTLSFGNSIFLTQVFSLLYDNYLDLPSFCLWITLYFGLGLNNTNSWNTTVFWALHINIQTSLWNSIT